MAGDLFELVQDHVTIFDMMERFTPAAHKAVRSQTVGHKIPCPFAAERHARGADNNPSAKFFPDTQSVYCWTCHGSWDVISFYAEAKQLYKTADDGTPIPDRKGGYQLDYGRAAQELGREFQLEFKVPDWYARLRKTVAALKDANRQAPTVSQTRKLSEVYADKLQRTAAPNLCAAAAQDYALGTIPDGSWVGIERDMHSWFEWSKDLLEVATPDRYTPGHDSAPEPDDDLRRLPGGRRDEVPGAALP